MRERLADKLRELLEAAAGESARLGQNKNDWLDELNDALELVETEIALVEADIKSAEEGDDDA